MSFFDCIRHNPIEDPPDELDAYGHLSWTVETTDGEWMACFDAVYEEETNVILYEVVVDGGCYVETVEKGAIPAHDHEKVRWLKTFPELWYEIGIESAGDLIMDPESLKQTKDTWSDHVDSLAARSISEEDEQANLEQSADYFNHYIAGDR